MLALLRRRPSRRGRSAALAALLATGACAAAAPLARAADDFPVPTTDAGLTDIVAGADGALWFSETKGGKVGRIGLDGAITEIAVPSHGEYGPTDLTVTGDGKVWFLSDAGDTLGWIDPAQGNAVRALELGDDGLGQTLGSRLTAAPDGSVWTSYSPSEQVSRFTPGATGPTETWTRTIDCGFDDVLASGPDGGVWCAFEGRALKRLGLDGNATVLPTVDGFNIASLAAGPDGAMWFGRHSSNGWVTRAGYGTLGRMALDGTVQEWPVGDEFAPDGLTAGPDGAVWFTDAGRTNTIGRIVPGGAPQLATLGPRRATAIAFGGDGNLWFADANANRITRMGRAEAVPPPAPPAPAPAPRPVPAPAPAKGPTVKGAKLRAAKGRVPLRIVCPAGGPACRGTVRVRTARKVRVPGAKRRARATLTRKASYAAKAGSTATVKARLTATGRRIVRRRTTTVVVELTPRGARKVAVEHRARVRG